MKFKVGDVCVGQSFVLQPEYNGMECIVLAYLPDSTTIGEVDRRRYHGPHYRVRWADGDVSCQWPSELRLKRPPSWDTWLYETSHLTAPKETV